MSSCLSGALPCKKFTHPAAAMLKKPQVGTPNDSPHASPPGQVSQPTWTSSPIQPPGAHSPHIWWDPEQELPSRALNKPLTQQIAKPNKTTVLH